MYAGQFKALGTILIPLIMLASACKTKEVVGTSAVDFFLKDIKGGHISYSEFKGKPTILYFFASW